MALSAAAGGRMARGSGDVVLVKKGHRIRVAIAGADADTFLRYPKEGGNPTIAVQRNRSHASHIELPVRVR